MSRIVVVSNRGPVSFDGEGRARRGAGGLSSALSAAMVDSDNTWIAAAMSDGDRAFAAGAPREAQVADTDLGTFRLRFVTLSPEDFHEFYDVVANRLIWFALHRMFDPVRRPLLDANSYASWDRFVAVNETFAHACIDEVTEGDRLLVQDYHLPLVPAMVRAAVPDLRIAHFTHTAWPAYEAMSLLPDKWLAAMVEGMVGADVVGFHSSRWARNFMETACEVAGAERVEGGISVNSRRVKVGVFPLGPDPEVLATAAASDGAQEAGRLLDEIIAGRRVVLRVERLEPAKNALRGLLAFESLLERDPARRESLVLISLSYRSRTQVPEYQVYGQEVEEQAERINQRFPGSLVLLTDDDFLRGLAALARYDVLVVNSIADGLNLVAKEGAIVNRNQGGLVLSRETGAADRMDDATWVVNPFDTAATADAISAVLDAPAEEWEWRSERARVRALEHNPTTWLAGQLRALEREP